jgi:hypothetical protein
LGPLRPFGTVRGKDVIARSYNEQRKGAVFCAGRGTNYE